MSAEHAPIIPINDDSFEQLVARRVTLREDLEYIQSQLDQIDEEIRARGIGNHPAGEWTVSVSPNRRLDPKRIEASYPVAQHPELYKPAVDTAAVKRHIAAIDLEDFYTEYQPRVVVK